MGTAGTDRDPGRSRPLFPGGSSVRDRPAAALVLLLALAGTPAPTAPTGPGEEVAGYAVAEIRNPGATEYRLYRGDHHFATVVNETGTFNLRPHPGEDPNGWGSSLYLQPFLPGAELKHASLEQIEAGPSGILLRAEGGVSRGVDGTFGFWSLRLDVSFDRAKGRMTAQGVYAIELPETLAARGGDLNLCKLASNRLQDVPLLGGSRGDTGDMKVAVVSVDGFRREWSPAREPTVLIDRGDVRSVFVEAVGDQNRVNSAAQGHAPILPAYKPTFSVRLVSTGEALPMAFFGMYDTGKNRDFWEDNVGMNLLVLEKAAQRRFRFEVSLVAQALPGDPGLGGEA